MRVAVLLLAVALALLALPRTARADDLQLFEVAEARYRSGQYEECAARFAELLGKSASGDGPEAEQLRGLQREARPMYAGCLLALPGKEPVADAVILTHLRADPRYQLPPGQFPDAVAERFAAVREQNRAELQKILDGIIEREKQEQKAAARVQAAQAKRLADLERLAGEETVMEERSRWIASIPFGVGQFHNGDTGLGVFFATSEGLAVASSIVTAIIGADRWAEYTRLRRGEGLDAEVEPGVFEALEQQYDAARVVNWVSVSTAAALAIAGVVQAHVAFDDSVTRTRKRPVCGPKPAPGERCVPPPVKVEPSAVIGADGVVLGATVQF